MLPKKFTPLQMNTIVIIIAVGITKIIGLFREILIANYFGINQYVDIYFYALIVPFFLFNVISGSFNIYFIPFYKKLKIGYKAHRACIHVGFLFSYMTIGILFLAILCGWIFPKYLLNFNKTIFMDPNQISYFYLVSYLTAVLFFFLTLSSLFTSLLQAEHHYALSLYPQALIPATSILFIFLYNQKLNVASILYGANLGSFVCFLLLYFFSLKKGIFRNFQLSFKPVNIKMNIDQFFILIASLVLPNFIQIVDQRMALALGHGKLTTLNYGMIIPDGLLAILVLGFSIASFSYFSQWFSEGRKDQIIEATQKIIIYSIFFILPICAFLMFYASPILTVILERGAFCSQNTFSVATIQYSYSAVLFFAITTTIGARIISATGKNSILLGIGVITFTTKILSNFIFIHFFSLKGIPMATVTMYMVANFIIYQYLHKKGFHLFQKRFLKETLKVLMVVLIICLILFIIASSCSILTHLIQVIIGLCILVGLTTLTLIINQKYHFFQFNKFLNS